MNDIAARRTALGLSQADLARQSGISARTLRRIEKGEYGGSPGAKRVLSQLASLEDDSAPTEQELEDSENRILQSNYAAAKLIGLYAFVAFLVPATAFVFSGLVDHTYPLGAGWWGVVVPAIVLVLSCVAHRIHDSRLVSTADRIRPDCERLREAIGDGRLRYIHVEALHIMRKILGVDAIDHAMGSRRCQVSVIGDESILSDDL